MKILTEHSNWKMLWRLEIFNDTLCDNPDVILPGDFPLLSILQYLDGLFSGWIEKHNSGLAVYKLR